MIKPRKTVQKMQPYFVNDRPCRIKLDANEGSSYLLDSIDGTQMIESLAGKGSFRANLYPDSDCVSLREKLAQYYGCRKENIVIGNGSSELIHFVISTYCEPGDRVLTFSPGFSMYDIYCQLCEAEIVKLESGKDFEQDIDRLIEKARETAPKVVILCNPNNPTGYVNSREDVIRLAKALPDTVIAVDEAYADFGDQSVVSEIENFSNLVVLRTMSKAFGLANLRVGCAVACEAMASDIWKVKVPYNLNGPSQLLAELALENRDRIEPYIQQVNRERAKLTEAVNGKADPAEASETPAEAPAAAEAAPSGKASAAETAAASASTADGRPLLRAYPSGANFVLIESPDIDLERELFERGIAIRSFGGSLEGFYRISIGEPDQNQEVIKAIGEIITIEERRRGYEQR